MDNLSTTRRRSRVGIQCPTTGASWGAAESLVATPSESLGESSRTLGTLVVPTSSESKLRVLRLTLRGLNVTNSAVVQCSTLATALAMPTSALLAGTHRIHGGWSSEGRTCRFQGPH